MVIFSLQTWLSLSKDLYNNFIINHKKRNTDFPGVLAYTPFLTIESIFNIFDYMLPDLIKRCIMHYEYLKGALSSQTVFGKPFENDEKHFIFHLKSSSRSQDI